MKKIMFFAAMFLGVMVSAGSAQQLLPPGKIAKEYRNPVLNNDFPDPTVIRLADGRYYAFATQGSFNGRLFNIQVATSDDRFHWRSAGDALPKKPEWADSTADFWAPHVLFDSTMRKYVMFFSSATDDTTVGKCIGVAFSDSAAGPYTDKGSPLICGESFVNIDPMAFIDPVSGRRFLYWGSAFKPLKVRELRDDWQQFTDGSTSHELVSPRAEKTYNVLLEGAWLDYQDGKYYLFYSGDNCCGPKAHYAVMVARSDSPLGPFQSLGSANGTGNSVILEQDAIWLAPGHNSIVSDAKGDKWIAYHAIDRRRLSVKAPGTKRVMLINRLIYKNGWPQVLKNN
jgi:arabinan endo-1,5-alpha-L-arabinosidase